MFRYRCPRKRNTNNTLFVYLKCAESFHYFEPKSFPPSPSGGGRAAGGSMGRERHALLALAPAPARVRSTGSGYRHVDECSWYVAEYIDKTRRDVPCPMRPLCVDVYLKPSLRDEADFNISVRSSRTPLVTVVCLTPQSANSFGAPLSLPSYTHVCRAYPRGRPLQVS